MANKIGASAGGSISGAAAAAKAAALAAARAAAKAAAEAAAKAAAAKAATAAIAKMAAEAAKKDQFTSVKGAVGATVGAGLKEVSAKLEDASKNLEPLPKIALEAKAAAGVAAQAAETPPSRWGVMGETFTNLKNKTESLVEQAKTGISDLTGAAKSKVQEGIQTLQETTKKIDEVLDGGTRELKRQTIDKPIDELRPGDKVNLNSEANIGVGIPGLNVGAGGVSVKGQVKQNIEVKADDDGSYTIKNELAGLESVSIGGTTQRGVDVSADSGGGGSMTTEYKVKPVTVKNADGTDKMVDGKPVIDDAATRAKVKELTTLLVAPPVKPQNPLLMQVKAAEDARTPEQRALMDESYSATEYKGSLANQVAASLGVPNAAEVKGSGKQQGDLSLRIEKADIPVRDENGKHIDGKTQEGVKISTSVVVNTELGGEGSVNPIPGATVNGDGKVAAKTTLSTSFEYPGKSDLSFSDLNSKVTTQKPAMSAQVSQELDVQVGGGAGVGGDVVVMKGNVRQMERIGATTTTTISVDDPVKNGGDVLRQVSQGKLTEAAKTAGDNTRVKIETNIYTERARIAEGGLKIGKAVDLSTKVESVQRTVVSKLPTVDATGTDIATATGDQIKKAGQQLEEAKRDLNSRPVRIRA